MSTNSNTSKNKTTATFLALTLGGFGVHFFYLYGKKNNFAWMHIACCFFSLINLIVFRSINIFYCLFPLILSFLVGFLFCMIIGTTADEKWDSKFNASSDYTSNSQWPVAFMLIIALIAGASGLIITISRTIDLLLTNGMYG